MTTTPCEFFGGRASSGLTWKLYTSNQIAVNGAGYGMDTTNGILTVTLPASAQDGDRVGVLDAIGNFGTYKCTVLRNGNTIMGLSEDMDLIEDYRSLTLVYFDGDWRVENTTPHANEPYTKTPNSNFLYNGSFRVNQRGTNGTSASSNDYISDRFFFQFSSGAFTIDNAASGSVQGDYAGLTVVTPFSPATSNHYMGIRYYMEGWDAEAFDGKDLMISFKIYTTITGTYTVGLRTTDASATTRLIIKEFTVTTSETWEQIEILVPIPESYIGSTLDDEKGLEIAFCTVAGTSYQYTPDTWITGGALAGSSANAVNWASSAANKMYLAEVKAEVGSIRTPFVLRPFEEELSLCQRYFYVGGSIGHGYGYLTSGSAGGLTNYAAQFFSFPVTMRAVPTATILSSPSYTNCSFGSWQLYKDGAMMRVTASALDRQYRAASGSFSFDAEL